MSNGIRLFDLHCDTITECCKQGRELMENELDISIKAGMRYHKWCQVFAVWIPDELRGSAAQIYFERNYNYFVKQVSKYKEYIFQCRSCSDVDMTLDDGKACAILSIEGGAALGGEISKIKEYFEKGVRIMTLTWNGENELGCGSVDDNGKGLTDFGKQAVSEMERLGMVVDVSHLNERGFYDVAEISKRPFIASHSNFSDVWEHKRNLTSEQISVIIERKGLIGLNLYKKFLGEESDKTIDYCYRHISYAIEAGCGDVLALGCDYDGADITDELKGVERLEDLYEYLTVRRIDDKILKKIFFDNAYDFFKNFEIQ